MSKHNEKTIPIVSSREEAKRLMEATGKAVEWEVKVPDFENSTKQTKVRNKDKRKNPDEPSVFVFRRKYTRIFHYIGDDGEPADIKVPTDLPVEIYIGKQYKVVKTPSILDDKIIIIGPISGEEIAIDWKQALEQRVELGEDNLSATAKDDVENYIAIGFMWRELIKQIKNGEIDAPTTYRKQHNLLALQDQFPDTAPFIERELKILEPLTDNRLHDIIIRYGDRNLKEEFERFPPDREIMSKLGVKTDYGRRAIVKTFGISVERFLALWKDADETIEALDKFKETEEKRLLSSEGIVKDVALDMVAALKVSVAKQKEAQWAWQNSQIDKMWRVMFPTSTRPVSDSEKLQKAMI